MKYEAVVSINNVLLKSQLQRIFKAENVVFVFKAVVLYKKNMQGFNNNQFSSMNLFLICWLLLKEKSF